MPVEVVEECPELEQHHTESTVTETVHRNESARKNRHENVEKRNHVGRDEIGAAETDQIIEECGEWRKDVVVGVVKHERFHGHVAQRVDVAIHPCDVTVVDNGHERRRGGNLHLQLERSIFEEIPVDGIVLDAQEEVNVEVDEKDDEEYEEGEKELWDWRAWTDHFPKTPGS